jgi:PHD/YefM family antitoxin component YafN of YafNO toxin-antitoxin module
MARAAPVAVTKYYWPVIVVMAVEEYEKLVERMSIKQGYPSSKAKRK